MIAKKLIIKGKVQGVSFRYYTRQEALRLGLCGTVRNLGNGDVEVWAEGEEVAVKSLVDWCTHGPRMARVQAVEIMDTSPVGYTGFSIVR